MQRLNRIFKKLWYCSVKINIVEIIKKETDLKHSVVKKGIKQGALKINGKTIIKETIDYRRNTAIKFQERPIDIEQHYSIPTNFDFYIDLLNQEFFKHTDNNEKVVLYACVVEYFNRYPYNPEELKSSEHEHDTFLDLEKFYHSTSVEGIKIKKRKLIDFLLAKKDSLLKDFEQKVNSVIKGHYEFEKNSAINDFSHFFNNKYYKSLIKPLYSNLDLQLIFKNIIIAHKDIVNAPDRKSKINLRIRSIDKFKKILGDNFQGDGSKISFLYQKLLSWFEEKTEKEAGLQSSGTAKISISAVNRTYNLYELPVQLEFKIENIGSGIARNIYIGKTTDFFEIPDVHVIDFLAAGEYRKIQVLLTKFNGSKTINNVATLELSVKYSNENDVISEDKAEKIEIKQQSKELPWDGLKRTNPYNIYAIEDPNKLFGREIVLEDLKFNIEKNSLSSD